MKFRIRFQKQSIIVDLPDANGQNACLKDLKQELKCKLPIPQFEVSLNGKDPIVGEDDTTLKHLGLVSGDRLHVLEIGKASDSVSSQKYSAIEKPQSSSNNERLSTTLQNPVKKSKVTSDPTDNKESTSTIQKEQEPGASSTRVNNEESMESEPVTTAIKDSEVNRYLAEPMLIRESTAEAVPQVLMDLYGGTEVLAGQNKHEAVCLVLHLLMLETGFQLQEKLESDRLPADWRKPGLCSLTYTVMSDQSITVTLMYVILADVGKVYAAVKDSGIKYSCTVKASDFVGQITQDACSTYTNLPKLSQMFKDKVSYPVLQAINKDGVPSLLNLTSEVQLIILSYLKPRDLVRIARVCKLCEVLSSEASLWRKLYLKKFGTRGESNNLSQDWKKHYREKTEERERMRRDYALMREPPSALPRVPYHLGPDPYNPMYPPGALGGDFDRDPFSPGVPGPFGRGALPRPRFDPMGPFPGQNPRPGRGGGLWEDTGGPFRHGGGRSGRGGLGGFI